MPRFAWISMLALVACNGDKPTEDTGPVTETTPGTSISTTTGTGTGQTTTVQTWDPADFDNVYNVGPGQDYATPNEVPWEALAPSSLVQIHYSDEPYHTKFVINTVATEADPLVVVGIPNASGERPVITGDNASTRQELNYWNESRSVVKIGGSNLPSDDLVPAWVYVESLEIRSGHPDYFFTDDSGNSDIYADNAASIHVEVGAHITIRDCELHDSGNGLFSGSQTSDLLIARNHIHGNGVLGSQYHHNNYTESVGITFEGNHFGPLRPGAGGNNLKDRSAGLVVRYNWIEGGSRELDLVDTDNANVRDDARYNDTWVYGNVLVEPEDNGNSQILHYGGDSGDTDWYRKGTLHFYNNTIVSERAGNTTLVRLSSSEESADMRNNIVAVQGTLGLVSEHGDLDLQGNWLQAGWRPSIEGATGSVQDSGTLSGDDAGFVDLAGHDFTLESDAACVDAGGDLAPGAPPLDRQIASPGVLMARPDDGALDCGALERVP